jgi:hypothetical protein
MKNGRGFARSASCIQEPEAWPYATPGGLPSQRFWVSLDLQTNGFLAILTEKIRTGSLHQNPLLSTLLPVKGKTCISRTGQIWQIPSQTRGFLLARRNLLSSLKFYGVDIFLVMHYK